MKKAVLLTTLGAIAREHNVRLRLIRQGKHEIWECGGCRFPVPRHREIIEFTAHNIIRDLRQHLQESA